MKKELKKVLPAVNLPLLADGRIDEDAFRAHLRWLVQFDVGGLVISGHAGELESLTPEERFQVAKMARAEIPAHLPMIVGVTGMSTAEAVACAKDAQAAGADALLVMPIPHFAFGAVDDPKLIVPYFAELSKQVGLPMILFRYHRESGLMYTVEVMLEAARQVPDIVAIKDSSQEYESTWVACQYFERKINMLPALGHLFLIRFMTSDGAVSSFSNVVPEFVIPLFELAHAGRMDEARRVFDKIRPLSKTIYHDVPLMQHWAVEKEALVARGRFPRSTVRPPFQPLRPEQISNIRLAIRSAGLGVELRETA